MNIEIQNKPIAIYGGFMDDNDKLIKSASGGIATALAEQMINSGGYVAGVAYSEDFYKAEYIITNSLKDLEKLKGSKYIETDKKDIYKKIKSLLEKGERVLFIGLPCTVAALYGFLNGRHKNLLTCELICHGPTVSKVHEEYITHLENEYNSKIVAFSVRYKKHGWSPSYLYAEFENGKRFDKLFYKTEYGFAFSVYGKKACYNCRFKGENYFADLMIGDFWGATQNDEFWNKNGVSVIFTRTEKGEEALKALSDVKLFPTTFERAVEYNPLVIKNKTVRPEREEFERLFKEKGLIAAARKFMEDNP